MKDRIKELSEQCWSHRIDGILIDGHLHFDVEKFANLIVTECIKACPQEDGRKHIREHFGIEK